MNAIFSDFKLFPQRPIVGRIRFHIFDLIPIFIRLIESLNKLFNMALHEVSLIEPLSWKLRWMRNFHKTRSFVHYPCMGKKCS